MSWHKKLIKKGNGEEEKKTSHWRLGVEQLHAVHVELSMVGGNPDCIQRRCKDAGEGENNSQGRSGFDGLTVYWDRIVVRDHAYSQTSWHQREYGFSRKHFAIQDEIHNGNRRCKQYSSDLVERDRRVG